MSHPKSAKTHAKKAQARIVISEPRKGLRSGVAAGKVGSGGPITTHGPNGGSDPIN